MDQKELAALKKALHDHPTTPLEIVIRRGVYLGDRLSGRTGHNVLILKNDLVNLCLGDFDFDDLFSPDFVDKMVATESNPRKPGDNFTISYDTIVNYAQEIADFLQRPIKLTLWHGSGRQEESEWSPLGEWHPR